MQSEVSPRQALEQALAQADGQPSSPALTAFLSATHEQLSALCEQAGDFQAALAHHRRFHQLSLQASGMVLLEREVLLPRLSELLNRSARLGAGLCMVGLAADGAQAGESQHMQLAELLRRQCRPQDLIARQGRSSGNGLLLALVDVDLASARKICERVRSAWPQQSGGGSLSMGLSAWRGQADELGRLLERAENALAAARRGGGNSLRSGAA
jgi:GGDEF domain-containing protein